MFLTLSGFKSPQSREGIAALMREQRHILALTD
jgi:hypothetical protein